MADATLPTTHLTLLTQLRQDPTDQAGWDEFVDALTGGTSPGGAGSGSYRTPTPRT